jgi:fibronectin-binding autotransporter adhesin
MNRRLLLQPRRAHPRSHRYPPRCGLRPVCLAAALLLGAAGAAWALPQGATLTSGQVNVGKPANGGLVIHQTSDKAGLNWMSFSIASGEWVRVDQPNAQSVLLNRVIGSDVSQIFGRLQSNGQVFLSNPRGIIFGRGSEIDVGGLVATTMAMADLGDGRYQLTQGSQAPASLTAQGHIEADGTVVLASPTLVQEGSIVAHRVGLAAAGSVLVDVDGDGLVLFNVRDQGLDGRLTHTGLVQADGGSAELRAAARAGVAGQVLNLEGVVQARTIGTQQGHIVIDGGAAGITRVAGTVAATGDAAATKGGDLRVFGEKILLDHSARLDVSGQAGGGELRVGGDYQGQGDLPRASMTTVYEGATLDASARDSGHGGLLVVWSDDATRFFGSVRADGGSRGGNGGTVEVSGKHYLDFRGRFSAMAPRGQAGSLLLDPDDIDINNSADTSNIGGAGSDADPFASTDGDPANLQWATIQSALNAGNVTVQTSNDGDITVTQAPAAALTGTNRLTFDSDADIAIQANISRIGSGDLVMNAVGAVSLTGDISLAGGDLTINAGSGITQSAASDVGTGAGLIALDGGAAAIALSGSFTTTSTSVNAIRIGGATTLQIGDLSAGTTGRITLTHTGTGSQAGSTVISSGALVKAGTGTLTLDNTNTFAGGTTVSAGTLRLSGGTALPTAGTLTINGGSVDVDGDSEIVGTVNLVSGSIVNGTLRSGGVYTLQSGAVSANLQGTGRVVKSGSGTVLLTGTNTYTGGTTVSLGTLKIGGGAALLNTGALTVAGGILDLGADTETIGALTLTGGSIINGSLSSSTSYGMQAGSVSANLLGTAALTKSGTGTVTLSGTNTYTGLTTVSAGTLALSGGAAMANGSDVTVSGGSLSLSGGSETVGAVTITGGAITNGTLVSSEAFDVQAGTISADLQGTAALAKTGTGSATLSGTNTYTGGSTVSAGTLVLSGGAAIADGEDLDVNGGTLSLNGGSETVGAVSVTGGAISNGTLISNTAFDVQAGTISADLQGTAALTKTGTGTTTLSGTNTYSGGSTVNAGTLALSGGSAISDSQAVTVNGGILSLSGDSETIGALTLTGGTISTGTLVSNTGFTVEAGTVSAALQGSAALTKQTNGSVTLSGANTYTGGTTVADGTLTASGGAALRDSATVAVASGATLALASSETVGSLSGSGSVALGSRTLSTGGDNSSTTFAGVIGGTGSVVKQGSGSLTLIGVNTYSGTTTVSAGTLVLGTGTALANTSALTVSGGLLDLGGSTETVGAVTLSSGSITNGSLSSGTSYTVQAGTVSANLLGSAALTKSGTGTVTLSGTNTYSGLTTVSAGSLAISGGAAIADAADVTVSGGTLSLSGGSETVGAVTITGGSITNGTLSSNDSFNVQAGTISADLQGNAALAKTGTGSATLSGTNTYAGSTTVSAGTLVLSGGAAIADGEDLNVSGGTLSLNGGSETVGAVSVTGGAISNGTLVSNTAFDVQAGTISADLQGSAALTKTGTGTTTLSGTNTYSGGTTVNAGTLTLSGGSAIDDSQGVTVNGGTLSLSGGSETIGLLTLTGGTISTGTLVSNTGFTVEAGTIGAALQGSAALIKQNTGSVTLSGANTYTGGTTVSDGTLTASGGAALRDSSVVVVTGGATLALASNETIGSLSGDGSVALGSRTLSTGGDNTSTTFSGVIAGTGSVVKQGSGSFSLAGLNTYGGRTTVSAGTLVLGSGTALADTSALTVSGGTLDLAASTEAVGAVTLTSGSIINGSLSSGTSYAVQAGTVSASLLGSAALTKSGTGTVTLSGTNSYTGLTTVSAGTLALTGGAAIADASDITVSGGTLNLSAGSETLGAVTITGGAITNGTLTSNNSFALQAGTVSADLQGSAALTKTGTGSATLSGTNTFSGGSTVSQGTLVLSGGAALADAGALTLAGGTLNLGGGSETVGAVAFTGGAVINGALVSDVGFTASSGSASANLQGSGGLTKVSTGTFTMTGTNTYSGGTTIEDGRLAISGGSALLDSGALVLNGGVLDLGGDTEIVGDLTFNGGSVVNGDLQPTGNLTVFSGSTSANLRGPGSLTKQGSGTFTISGRNTFTGGTFVLGGSLVVAGGRALSDVGEVTVASGATLGLAASETIGSLTGGGTVALGANTLTTGGNNLATSFVGAITGSGALVKLGSGIFTLGGANSFTGGTTVSAGTLQLEGGSALADSGSVIVNGGILNLAGVSETVGALLLSSGSIVGNRLVSAAGFDLRSGSVSADLAGSGGLTKKSSGTVTLSGTNTFTGVTAVNAGTLVLEGGAAIADTGAVSVNGSGTLSLLTDEAIGSLAGTATVALGTNTLTTGGADTDSTFAGRISGTGGLVKTGSGAFTLSGANTFSGGSTVAEGTLVVDGGQALLDTGAVTVSGGTLSANGGSETVGTVSLQSGSIVDGTFSSASGFALQSGNVSAGLAGSAALTKMGSGTVTLSGQNAYTGGTAVQGGTLRVAGGDALPDAGAVILSNTAGVILQLAADESIATLAGGGSAGGLVDLANHTLSVGATGASSSFAGRIVGTGGGLTKLGSGSFTLLGDNSYTGITTIDGGVLQLGNGGSSGTLGRGAVANRGTLRFVHADRIVVANTISGTGRLDQAGSGTLVLTGNNSYQGSTTVRTGSTLQLGEGGASGTLGSGNVANSGTLTVQRSGNFVLANAISGTGTFVQAGSGTTILTGNNTYSGTTAITDGVLQVGNGGTAGTLGSGAVNVAALLRFDRSNSISVGNAITGSGAVEQAGSGTLTLASTANAYTGGTRVSDGTLATAGAQRLPDAGAVQVDAAGHLELRGDETIASLDADGWVTLHGDLTSSGDQRFGGALVIDGSVALTGREITALSDDNQLGSDALQVSADRLALSSGIDGGTHRDLTLGAVSLAQGGSIEAGTLTLQGDLSLAGGTLALNTDAAVSACSGNGLCGEDTRFGVPLVVDGFGRELVVAQDTVVQSAGRINVAEGASLNITTAGGSVALNDATNSFLGALSVDTGAATANNAPSARVSIAGTDVNVGGINSELVRIRADRLFTLGEGTIVARLPFSDAIGTSQQVPGLLLELGPTSFDAGGFPFGSLDQGIAVNVGIAAPGGPTGGYVTVRPKSAEDAQAAAALISKGAAVFLIGPASATGGYVLFYDGAKLGSEVPVWYNGFLPETPEAEGALSSVASISESARRDRFEETVRTENVAVRLRSGVIAEVGPGRPATEGTRGATLPPSCDAPALKLGCDKAEPAAR